LEGHEIFLVIPGRGSTGPAKGRPMTGSAREPGIQGHNYNNVEIALDSGFALRAPE